MTARRARAIALALSMAPAPAGAQELEPGAYWPIPAGMNIVTAISSVNVGDVAFDPAAPIDAATSTIGTLALTFTRGFALAGRSAQISVAVPITRGRVEGLYLGQAASADRFGSGDPRVRVSMNLRGAPAMTPEAFASYRQGTIFGISVTVAPPLGEYDPAKLVNLGTNRWSFKPEFGFSRTSGAWVVEAMAGIWLFADNTRFLGELTREQDPLSAVQGHVTYRFTRTTLLAADVNYFTGGRTTIGGRLNADLQRNSRIGATFSSVIGHGQAIRASVSTGAFTTIGADFTSIAVAYSYAWTR